MSDDLSRQLEEYRLALDTQLALLHRLQRVATQQRTSTDQDDFDALQRAADEREGLVAGLMAIEQRVKDVRQQLTARRTEARRLPAMTAVASLHKAVTAAVSAILETDRLSIEALERVVDARRLAMQALEQGDSMLAAYSRTSTPPPAATLFDRRG